MTCLRYSANQAADEDLSDEELARRLQEEEDQAAYDLAYAESARMADLTPDAAAESVDGADGELPLDEEQEQSAMPFSYEDMLALGDLAGKVSKGLKEEALSRLPVVRVCSLREEAGVASLDRCCICQLEFEDDDEVTPLPCRHCYHSDCVRQWLQQSKACPVCGKELEAA
ncbi:hypothetical protein PLESTB_001243200 [Pleodorina starrii]|uniref:RING-type domain-containing protein n=1 Tax=Pleodorina starrii TaxID=330485 RepID=A0A9W6F6G5_9CHLO|nr:hypothetical protein PLESTB_001243200 [Pleodorina starrii]GLC63255.1 hypothetical protein PLESTF_000017000 [Pleodorina starrii]